MISKGSCDTEDWNNAENLLCITGINYILKCIQIEFYFLISLFYCICVQINLAMVIIRDFFKQNKTKISIISSV